MWLLATAAGRTPLPGRANFGIAELRNPSVIELTYWTRPEYCRAQSDRSGAIGEPEQGQHDIARPSAPGDVDLIAAARSEACSWHGPARSCRSDHAHTNAPQPWDCLGLLILRDRSEILTHSLKCGWRAAQASMAHDMPRSSCCPGGQIWTVPVSRISVSRFASCSKARRLIGPSTSRT